MSERKVRQRNLHAELPDAVLLQLLAAGLRGEPHPVLPGTVPPKRGWRFSVFPPRKGCWPLHTTPCAGFRPHSSLPGS